MLRATTAQFGLLTISSPTALITSDLSYVCSGEIDAFGSVLYAADAYRKDGKRFAVIADAKLTALLKLERATRYDGD